MSDTAGTGGATATTTVAAEPQAPVAATVPPGLVTGQHPNAAPAAPVPAADPAATPAADPAKPADGDGKTLLTGADPTKEPAAGATGPAAPTDYTPIAVTDLTLPEGVAADDPMLAAALAGATTAKISKDQLQPVIDAVAPILKEAQEAPLREWAAKQKDWVKEIKADPEIGGAALDKTVLPGIARLLDQHGGKELREALDFTGAGNHPAVVKFLHRVAQSRAEGTPVRGNPSSTVRDAASVLYPTHSRANGAG
jgi:hypothetical protein